MEELDIKKIWKSGDESEGFNYSSQTIDRILSQGPQNIISKFVKTLKIEQWINLVAFMVLSIAFVNISNWWAAIITQVVNVTFFLYYKNLIKRLDKEYVDSNVVQYLEDIYKIMKRFIRHYKIATVILIFPGMWLGIYLSGSEFNLDKISVEFLLVTIAAIGAIIFAASYAIYLMYGKKAAKIKNMIDSLSQEEI